MGGDWDVVELHVKDVISLLFFANIIYVFAVQKCFFF